ncbi:MAG: hypothetical protein K8R34_11330 [Methanosarcinales archaeon]|nr:hypothetical protein [Methanosarcinales archaeon]
MIFEYPDKSQPIRQGDIFYPLPLMALSLNNIAVLSEDGKFKQTSWEMIKNETNVVVNAPIKPVWGVVATQDCDSNHAPVISIFEIGTFNEITKISQPSKTKIWVSLITQKSRLNARWFYLPRDETIGFKERIAINFHVVFHIFRDDLEKNVEELRKGKLNKIAFQHYRESIAQYFRRYPYDEWYPLNNEEFEEYNKNKGPVDPFEWQK